MIPEFILPFFLSSSNAMIDVALSYPASAILAIVACRMLLNMRTYVQEYSAGEWVASIFTVLVTNKRELVGMLALYVYDILVFFDM